LSPLPSQNIQITGERLIVGEGDSDAAFFKLLCEVRGINGFDIRGVSGNASFGNFLKAAKGIAGARLRSVVLVADNDETPRDSFLNIRGQIPDGWAHPNNPFEKLQRPDTPYIVVVMLPFPRIGASSHGCLESMLLQAAEPTLPAQKGCLDAFSVCVGSDGWNVTSRDKMRLRCLMSASFRDDPNAGLQYSLKPERGLIPLTHPHFDELADFLTNLDNWLASGHVSWDAWKAARAAAAQRAG
jgi:hypothetical protein